MKELKKNIGFSSALATIVGVVIGSGAFFKAAIIYETTKSMSLGTFAWILGGIISICGGVTTAELAAAIPKTGGMIVWIERAYGKKLSYLLGWTESVIYFPACIAAISVIFSTQILNIFHLDKFWYLPVAIISATFATGLNLLGSKVGGSIQIVVTVCKLVPIIGIVIFGLFQTAPEKIEIFPSVELFDLNNVTSLGACLLATMYAYDGWIDVGSIAGEMKNPKKDLPRAIFFGIFFTMLIYVFINVAFLKTIPLYQISGNHNSANLVATKLFGPIGGKIISLGILISMYGTLNGKIITGIRIPYAVAESDQIPGKSFWLKLNRFSMPYNCAIVMLIIAIGLMFTGKFDTLTDLLLFTIWLFYVLTFFAVFILRKKEPNLERPYKVPFYPVVPIIAILGGCYILIITLINSPLLAFCGIACTLIGFIFYKDTFDKIFHRK